jgi:hypothetical protein
MNVTVKAGEGIGLLRYKLQLLNKFKHNDLVLIDERIAEYLVSEKYVAYATDEEIRNGHATASCEVTRPLKVIAKDDTRPVDPRLVELRKDKTIKEMMEEAKCMS